MQDQTLRTLAGLEGSGRGKVFNKLRMTVFPKWYVYNHANPVEAGTAVSAAALFCVFFLFSLQQAG